MDDQFSYTTNNTMPHPGQCGPAIASDVPRLLCVPADVQARQAGAYQDTFHERQDGQGQTSQQQTMISIDDFSVPSYGPSVISKEIAEQERKNRDVIHVRKTSRGRCCIIHWCDREKVMDKDESDRAQELELCRACYKTAVIILSNDGRCNFVDATDDEIIQTAENYHDPDANVSCWNARFDQLKEFKNCHGHCNVPASKKYRAGSLGSWVSNQRYLNSKGKLTPERFRKLNDLGLKWKVRPESWIENFEKLADYKERKGHCNVPVSHGSLGKWVCRQRAQNGKLRPDRKEKLNSIGFKWKTFPTWIENFEKLAVYKERKGDCNVPMNSGSLGCWVNNQRSLHSKGKLRPDRQKKLNSIVFVWKLQRGPRKFSIPEPVGCKRRKVNWTTKLNIVPPSSRSSPALQNEAAERKAKTQVWDWVKYDYV